MFSQFVKILFEHISKHTLTLGFKWTNLNICWNNKTWMDVILTMERASKHIHNSESSPTRYNNSIVPDGLNFSSHVKHKF